MKNAHKNFILIAVLSSLVAIPAWSADNSRVESPPSALDEWDDDMWSDWGAPAQSTKAQTEEKRDEPNAPDASAPDFGGPNVGSSFGKSADGVIHFRLVRDSGSSEDQSVRKYRPTYKRKRL